MTYAFPLTDLRDSIAGRYGIDLADPVSIPVDKTLSDLKKMYQNASATVPSPESVRKLEYLRLTRAYTGLQDELAAKKVSMAKAGATSLKGQSEASGRWYADMEDEKTRTEGPDAEVADQDFWDSLVDNIAKPVAHGFTTSFTSAGVAAGAVLKKTTGVDWLYDDSMAATSFLDEHLGAKDPSLLQKVMEGAGALGSLLIPGSAIGGAVGKATKAWEIGRALEEAGALGRFLNFSGKLLGGTQGIVGGTATGAAMSVVDAGAAIQAGKSMGMTDEQALEAGKKVILPNLVIGALSNFAPFSPAIRASSVMKGVLVNGGKLTVDALSFGAQNVARKHSQQVALGVGEWAPNMGDMDEFVVGAILGLGAGAISHAVRGKVELPKYQEEQPLDQHEARLDAAIGASQQARRMPTDELNNRIAAMRAAADRGDMKALSETMGTKEFVSLKALMNERARRGVMAEAENKWSPDEMNTFLKAATEIGYQKMTPGEKGFTGILTDLLSAKGKLDPEVGSKLAHQMGLTTKRGLAFNADASANSGKEFLGALFMDKRQDGSWVVDAQDKNFNHIQRVFETRGEADAFRKEAAARLQDQVPEAVQPQETKGQEFFRLAQERENLNETRFKAALGEKGEYTIDTDKGATALGLDKAGKPTLKRGAGKFAIKILDDAQGMKALGEAGKSTLDVIRKANIRVKFYTPENKKTGLLGFYEPKTRTTFIRADKVGQSAQGGHTIADFTLAHEFGHWISGSNYDTALKMFEWIKKNQPELLAETRKRVRATGYAENQYHSEAMADAIAGYLIKNKGFGEMVNESPNLFGKAIRLFANHMGVKDLNSKDPVFAGTKGSQFMVSLLKEGLRFEGEQRHPLVQGSIEARDQAIADITPRSTVIRKVADFHHWLYSRTLDEPHLLKVLLRRAGDKTDTAYRNIRTKWASWVSLADQFILDRPRYQHRTENGHYAPIRLGNGKPAKSLSKIMSDNDVRPSEKPEFDSYLEAKATIAWAKANMDKLAPETQERLPDYQERIDVLEKTFPHFKKAAQEFSDYNKALVLLQAESSSTSLEAKVPGKKVRHAILSIKDMKNILGSVDFYAPLWSPKELAGWHTSINMGLKGGKPVKSMRLLYTDPVASPVESAIISTYQVAKAVRQTEAMRLVVEAGKKIPTVATEVSLAPEARTISSKQAVDASGALKAVFKAIRDMESEGMLPDAEAVISHIQAAKKSGDLFADLPPTVKIWLAGRHLGENMISYVDNGILRVFKVDPVIYDLFKSEPALSMQNGWPMKMAAKMTGFLRLGAIYTPDFMSRNLGRDFLTMLITNPTIKPTPKGLAKFVTEWGKSWKRVIKRDPVYQDAQMSGALMGDSMAFDRPTISRRIRAMMTKGVFSKDGYVNYMAKHPLDAIYQALVVGAQTSEEVTRVAGWKVSADARMGKKGMNARSWERLAEIAAMDARDSTLDFMRFGKYGRAANMLIPFFNANIQGQDKLIRSLFSKNAEAKKATWAKAFLSLTVPSLVLHEMNKDKDWYKALPAWERNVFWMIRPDEKKKTIIRLPKPYDYGLLFASLPEAYSDHVGGDPFAMKEWYKQYQAMTNLDLNSVLRQGVPMVSALMNMGSNYDPFRQSPIEKGAIVKLPPHLRATESTSKLAAKLFPYLYEKSGGKLDWSPTMFDYFIRASFAQLGRYAVDLAGIGIKKDEDAPTGPGWEYTAPLIKSFLTRDPSSFNGNIERLYNMFDEADQSLVGFNHALKDKDFHEAVLLAQHKGRNIAARPFLYDTLRQLNGFNAAVAAIRAAPASMYGPLQKRKRIDYLREQQQKLAQKAIDEYIKEHSQIDSLARQLLFSTKALAASHTGGK